MNDSCGSATSATGSVVVHGSFAVIDCQSMYVFHVQWDGDLFLYNLFVCICKCICMYYCSLHRSQPQGLDVRDSENDGESVGEWGGGVCVV